MSFTFIRSKEDICRERAKEAARIKFDSFIKECAERASKSHSAFDTSEHFALYRKKSLFEKKAYSYYMNNYEVASDKYVQTEDAEGSSIKGFTNYLIDELSKL